MAAGGGGGVPTVEDPSVEAEGEENDGVEDPSVEAEGEGDEGRWRDGVDAGMEFSPRLLNVTEGLCTQL